MDDTATVGVSDCLAEVGEVGQQVEPIGQRPAVAERLGEGAAADPLHRVIQSAIRADAQLIDRHDTGMLQLAGDPCLAQEADDGERRGAGGAGPGHGKCIAAHRELAEQFLEHDLATQVPVVHQQDPADPPASQLGRRGVAAGIVVSMGALRSHREQVRSGFRQVRLIRPLGRRVVGGCPHACIVTALPAGFNV